jgi:hypothetical protein
MDKKYNNFTTIFRNDVDRVAEEIGLTNTTSPRQIKNGTIELTDQSISNSRKRVIYTLHENGYIRRRIFYYRMFASDHSYTLNRRTSTKNSYGHRNYTITPAGPIEQLGILVNSVLKYRTHVG